MSQLPNPVGEEFFSIPRREKFPRIFCAAGGICARKNVLGLVQAYAELKARVADYLGERIAALRGAGEVVRRASLASGRVGS